ncbi:UNVERIFIED_ORG: hypothetical protein M2312_004858 [Rhizobium esperanzae]|nr:hypothetical protein [Rhizobium esperanzae]
MSVQKLSGGTAEKNVFREHSVFMAFRKVDRAPLRFTDRGEVSEELTASLKAYFTRNGRITDLMAEEAEDFFHALKGEDRWLACDCEICGTAERSPLLHAVEGIILRRNPPRTVDSSRVGQHTDCCDFVAARGRPNSDEDNTCKFVEPDRRPREVTTFGLLRRFRTTRNDREGVHRENGKVADRTRSSTHAHLLLTLLDRAKINRWDYGAPSKNLSEQYTAMRNAAAELPIADNLNVGDLIISSPKLIGREDQCQEVLEEPYTLRSKIAAKAVEWPSGSRPHGFLCTRVDKFAGGVIDFGPNHFRRSMQNKPHVFAECRDVMVGPFIALISYACATPTDSIYDPFGCYAQPCVASDDCAPVDSTYEKRTLGFLRSVQRTEAASKGARFNIVKPLFDLTVTMPNGQEELCRPDFILEVLGRDGGIERKIVVETMGRQDDPEYDESKRTTHPRMHRINGSSILVTHNVSTTGDERTPDDTIFFSRLYKALRSAPVA